MKRSLTLLFFLACFLAGAQTRTQQKTGVTATGDNTDFPNPITSNPAIGWRLNFHYTGASCTAAVVQLDCAPDNGSGGAGSYGTCTGAVDGTTNPVTANAASFQAGTIALKVYTPHIAVNPTTLTGSGCSVNWNLTGLFGAFNVPTTTSGGGGGGGTTVIETVCDPANGGSQKQTTLSGTGFNSLVGASAGKNIYLCNIAVTSASGGTPNVNTFTIAKGNCAGSPTAVLTLPGVTGYTDQFLGTLTAGTSNDLCFSESVANGDAVTVTYLQK